MLTSLQPYNTFRLDVSAEKLIPFSSEEVLQEVLTTYPLIDLILGGGSNILFKKKTIGTVIKNEILGKKKIEEDAVSITVEFGAGENWHDVVTYCVNQGWQGIENLALIPGTVGAAPIQNIGAYGVELKEVLVGLHAVDRKTQEKVYFDLPSCELEYRSSIFKTRLKDRYVITRVVLKLKKMGSHQVNFSYSALKEELDRRNKIYPTMMDIYEAVISVRSSKLPDPGQLGNAGSFFKNPIISIEEYEKMLNQHKAIPSYSDKVGFVKIPAAWLIEQSGFKGKRFGDAGVHDKQALVLVNYGQATGEELTALAETIQAEVKAQFGVNLMMEVNVYG